ncbi:hypothetical protein OH492_21895 [Vibrio chagasii]|nr:hypothetical protein [Vibrio chagasii]
MARDERGRNRYSPWPNAALFEIPDTSSLSSGMTALGILICKADTIWCRDAKRLKKTEFRKFKIAKEYRNRVTFDSNLVILCLARNERIKKSIIHC